MSREIENLTIVTNKEVFSIDLSNYDKIVEESIEREDSSIDLIIDFYKDGKVVRSMYNIPCDITYKKVTNNDIFTLEIYKEIKSNVSYDLRFSYFDEGMKLLEDEIIELMSSYKETYFKKCFFIKKDSISLLLFSNKLKDIERYEKDFIDKDNEIVLQITDIRNDVTSYIKINILR